MWEFDATKNTGQKEQILTIEDGKLKTVNEFDNISTDHDSLNLGGSLFLESFKNQRNHLFPGWCAFAKVLQELAQCSIQSRIRRSSGARSPTSVDIGRIRSGGSIFLGNCVRNSHPGKSL